ncbi:MAG TPA: hypothetical protein VGG89_09900 [Candidatus Baltobacteraceae bacterium]|jgi:hypothetical protein
MKRGALLALALTACTTGQANTTPPITSGPPPGSGSVALQLSLGTANLSGLNQGVNLLETFRGAQGYTAIPITTATLTGPLGLQGPKHSKDPGSGKAAIPIGAASNQFQVGPTQTRVLAGADGFGIGPPGCSCAGINFYPFQPQFADVAAKLTFGGGTEPFYGGPPAYPATTLAASALSSLVQIPSSSPEGFYMIAFKKLPPAGKYTLTVTYSQNGRATTQTASAEFRPALLPSFTNVTAHSDHRGGAVVTLRFPRGVNQALVNIIDANVPPAPSSNPCNTGLGFATLRFDKSGTLRVPDDLGNYGKGGAKTFCKGDLLNVQVIGFDYDDFGIGPPGNTQQRPRLPARADLTYSTVIVVE